MTLTKEDLVDSIHNHLGLTKIQSNEVFEFLFEIMKNTLENGDDILVSGFGKFCVKNKGERKWRNARTGKFEILGKKRIVVFKWSEVLRDMINGKK